jgi:hypothetical protein
MSFRVGGRGAFQANIVWCIVFPAKASRSNSILLNVAIIISLNFSLFFASPFSSRRRHNS